MRWNKSTYEKPASSAPAKPSPDMQAMELGYLVQRFFMKDYPEGYYLGATFEGTGRSNVYAPTLFKLVKGKPEEVVCRASLIDLFTAANLILKCKHRWESDGWCDSCDIHKSRYERLQSNEDN